MGQPSVGASEGAMRRFLLIAAVATGLAYPPSAPFANAVSDWDAVASTTIVTNAGIGPGPAGIWFTYVHLAIYDAVNSIDGGFRPYLTSLPAEAGANEDAAAVAAAHDVLVHY